MSYFEPSSSERRGLIILVVAVLLGLCVVVIHLLQPSANSEVSADQSTGRQMSYGRRSSGSAQYYAQPEREVETFDFDPNEADSTALLRLGFAPYQVRGIYKYRAMGGRYHEPADVQRIPGMTNEMWDRLAPHIRIDKRYQYVTPEARSRSRLYESQASLATDSASRLRSRGALTATGDSPFRDTLLYPVKLRPGQRLDVNSADTSRLKKIPGVGSYYARSIAKYRDELGGFVNAEQLYEVEGVPYDIADWVNIDTTHLRRLDVNHATKRQLARHPYLRGKRASEVWQWVHNNGPLPNVDALRQLPSFREQDVERLRPYLIFR